MRTFAWMIAALASGCSLIVPGNGGLTPDLVDGGGQRGADGGRDAGRDGGCALVTYYADRDGDGDGDPSSTLESCEAPEGYVSVAGDCDDDDAAIRPGAEETCDDVDQDCDGAIDEGLIGPLGTPIEILADRGGIDSMAPAIVAHRDGLTVLAQHYPDVPRASFYDRDGNLLAGDVLATPAALGRQVRLGRYHRDGLDQVLFVWTVFDEILARLCSTAGESSTIRTIHSGDTSEVENLAMSQLHDRVIIRWESPAGLHLVSHDPVRGTLSEPLEIAPVPGRSTSFHGLASVSGPVPYSLVGRSSGIVDGTMVLEGDAHLLRIRGDSTLTFDEATDTLAWDAEARCSAAGLTTCFVIALPGGTTTPDDPGIHLFEILTGYDDVGGSRVSYCLRGLVPRDDSGPEAGECIEFEGNRWSATPRGTVATVVQYVGSGFAVGERALFPPAEGSTLTSLPGLPPDTGVPHSLSMHRGRGGLLARRGGTGAQDVHLFRLGCSP